MEILQLNGNAVPERRRSRNPLHDCIGRSCSFKGEQRLKILTIPTLTSVYGQNLQNKCYFVERISTREIAHDMSYIVFQHRKLMKKILAPYAQNTVS